MDRTGESNISHSGLLSGDSGTELGRAVLEAGRSRDLRGLDLWRRVEARYEELIRSTELRWDRERRATMSETS